MRVVIQRVSQASVIIDEKKVAAINDGLLVLLGVETQDTKEDSKWLANKISSFKDLDHRSSLSSTSL